jgi:hypothetical protein
MPENETTPGAKVIPFRRVKFERECAEHGVWWTDCSPVCPTCDAIRRGSVRS